MNPLFDPAITKNWSYPNWYRLWLWLFPTYVSLDSDSILEFKVVRGDIYITGIEDAPWKGKSDG